MRHDSPLWVNQIMLNFVVFFIGVDHFCKSVYIMSYRLGVLIHETLKNTPNSLKDSYAV